MTLAPSGLAALASGAVLSPFTRLRNLLADIPAGHAKPIDLTLGEPRETMPGFISDKIREAEALFAKYPPIKGSDALRAAIAEWLDRRFNLAGAGRVDAAREVLPSNGSREGLFYAAFPAVGRKAGIERPAILICNPYYQAYIGAALATGAEPVYLDATAATGHLPNLDEIADDIALLDRTAAFYLCSPANPQGAVASREYIARALGLARRHDFMLFLDECYSEIYAAEPPIGGLEVAAATPERFRNLVVFNSLSKRSNLPGLRSGFAAGDADFRYAHRSAQSGRSDHAGAGAARIRRSLGRGAARGGQPIGVPGEIRCLRRGSGRSLRLRAPGRRILPLARYEPTRRRQ